MRKDEIKRLVMTIVLIIFLLLMGLVIVTSLITEERLIRDVEKESTSELGNGISDVIYETYTNALDTTEVDRAEVREINTMIDVEIEKVEYSEDIKLLAQLVLAEAENQPMLGQLLVADVVMNRVDHEKFPNTVRDVIYQPGQFECVSNGRFDSCADKVTDFMCEVIYNEMYQRQSWNVLYFRTGDYFNFGTPACQVGDHFFSEE